MLSQKGRNMKIQLSKNAFFANLQIKKQKKTNTFAIKTTKVRLVRKLKQCF